MRGGLHESGQREDGERRSFLFRRAVWVSELESWKERHAKVKRPWREVIFRNNSTPVFEMGVVILFVMDFIPRV
jgi:hypothetical protein